MASTLVRFRLAGIPVRVRPWFVVVVALGGLPRGWAGGAVWFAVVTVSVLWHELGHALTMKAFGDEPWIELDAMGGRAHWPAGANPAPGEALLVIAAGPVAGLALGAAAWALSQATGSWPFLAELALRDAVWVNVWWSLFNLLPMLPLDGAQLLDQVSRLRTGRREPVWVGVLSVAAGGSVVALAAQGGMRYVALLGGIAMVHGLSRMGAAGLLSLRRTARSPLEAVRARARRALANGDLVGVAVALLPEARLGRLDEQELAQLVGALVRLGREEQLVSLCRDRLTTFARKGEWIFGGPLRERMGRGEAEALARLASEALVDGGADEEAVAVSQLAFQQLNVPYHAYDAACALVRLGRHEEAVCWLVEAVEAGLDCAESIRTDPDLDPLRDRADFVQLASLVEAGRRTAQGPLLN